MLNDNWQKLLMRLRTIANNEFNGRRLSLARLT